MTKRSSKDYESIGKLIAEMVDSGNPNKVAVYKTAFIKGIFSGLGGVIGATIIVGFLLWIVGLFGELPLIGRFIDTIESAINAH
jgi:hypothetical protein